MYYLFVIFSLFVIELLYFKIADKYNIIDKPNERSSHQTITLRGGGIIFYIGALIYFLFCGFHFPWFMLGLTLICIISFADDIHSIPDKYRLIIQFVSMFLMLYELSILNMNWWWIVLALIICTGILNAYNFMDGINGITGGYSLVVLCLLLYVNVDICEFVDNRLILTVICATLVFCFFNFRKKAKCFAGDVGSIGIAFIIVFLLGRLIQQTEHFGWMAFLSVYGADTILTIIHRIKLRENLGVAHRKHMFQIMANELHIEHIAVSLIYMMTQLLIGFFFILFPTYYTLIICCIVLIIVYVVFMLKYYPLHEMTLLEQKHE